MTAVTRTLLGGLVDYAGLFPPAQLDMTTAATNYAAYRAGEEGWMLGGFVVPVTRLDELDSSAERLFPRVPARDAASERWRLSALSGDVERELPRIDAFNSAHADPAGGAAVIDTVEIRVATPADVVRASSVLRGAIEPYFEIALTGDTRALIAAVATVGARAKVRTGGVTPDLFPTTAALLSFMRGCIDAGVAFKATAGLHHAIRAAYPLTYESGSARATMYGFLNLFLAAAFMRAGLDDADAGALLEERSPDAFRFAEDGVTWRGNTLDIGAIAAARKDVATSFGSCSFTEPVEELRALHLLP